MTGVDDPYEIPESPEVVIAGDAPLDQSVGRLLECLDRDWMDAPSS